MRGSGGSEGISPVKWAEGRVLGDSHQSAVKDMESRSSLFRSRGSQAGGAGLDRVILAVRRRMTTRSNS